jgi:hypothetical protein
MQFIAASLLPIEVAASPQVAPRKPSWYASASTRSLSEISLLKLA